MLLKYSQAQKRMKATGMGKPQRTAGGMVKLTAGLMTVVPKIHRRVVKVANKRPATIHRTAVAAVKRERIPVDPCDNSNDSGLGFDHHLDYAHHPSLAHHPGIETSWPGEEPPEVKRRRLEIKLESDDANDNFTFQEAVRQQQTICVPVRRPRPAAPLTLNSQLLGTSSDGLVQLIIMCQPEQQHRARYQTEGSRGAVKDRTGNGFPVVKLVGYDRPATLQVFIGTDQGKVAPHMFYQACRVSGKNSTPCVEKKIDGTIVIEVDIEPSKDMVVTCDCVGILKERNVDVEHRFPEEGSGRSKKKSTRCRMVFRTTITRPDGSLETLQVTSQPIVCTQPPGVPEICKKSLTSCGARGGQELFILGKNFLKDTRVVFQEGDAASPTWAQAVQPDKEFLQQSHLVCVVPPYRSTDITEPVTVRLVVESSGKASEPHAFLYLPESTVSVLGQEGNVLPSSVSPQVKFLKASSAYRGPLLTRRRYRNGGRTGVFAPTAPIMMPTEQAAPFLPAQTYTGKEEKVHPVMMWNKTPEIMMPPPPPPGLPLLAMRRSSVSMIVPDPLAPEDMKREVPEATVKSEKPMSDVSERPSAQATSMDTFHRYVSNSSLPSINVGNYLTSIESSSVMSEMPRIMIPSPAIVNKQMFSGDSSNLLTTVDPVLANQSGALSFERAIPTSSSVNQTSPKNLSVIVNSSVKKSPEALLDHELQTQKEMSGTNNMGGLNIIMSPIKRNPSATERLDAFVNSAAESHISPTPSSPVVVDENSRMSAINEMENSRMSAINEMENSRMSVINEMENSRMSAINEMENSRMSAINEMVMSGSGDLNKVPDTNVVQEIQTPLHISPRMSPHQENSNMNEGPLCSLMSSSVQTASNSVQTLTSVQNSMEQHLSQSNMSNLMQSPPQVSPNQLQQFTKMPSPIDQHLSPHNLTTQQISSIEISSIMQSTSQNCPNQSMTDFQTSLERQLSPPMTVNSSQMNDTELNNLIQNSSQSSSNQVQELSNIQVSLEQQLSSQAINSTQMNPCNMNNPVTLIQSTCNLPNQVQVMSNLPAPLEHISNQTITSGQMLQPESIQSNNMGMNNISDSLQTSPLNSANRAQSLSNIQAALEHQLSSQGMSSVQNSLDSMSSRNITLDNLNCSVAASQIQAAVSQAQALSNFQASMQQLSSQVMGSTSEMNSNPNSSNIMNSPGENSIDQTQNLTNLQMSYGQVMSSNQQSLDPMTNSSMSLSNPMQSSPEHVAVTQAQVYSDLQASYNHHLNANIVGSMATSQSASLERLTNLSSDSSSSQTMPMMQSSMNRISPSMGSSSANQSEPLTTNNLSIGDSQIIDLRSSVPMMVSQTMNVSNTNSAGNMLSPPSSRHSPASVLTSPGISMSSTPTMALSPADLANSQAMDAGSQNIILSSPQPMLTSELSMNNPSTLPLASGEMMQESQVAIQSSAMAQNLPQVSSMAQYERRQELAQGKEGERKFMMAAGSVARPQTEQTQMPLPHELTQMSEHDLISYINPSCFDTV